MHPHYPVNCCHSHTLQSVPPLARQEGSCMAMHPTSSSPCMQGWSLSLSAVHTRQYVYPSGAHQPSSRSGTHLQQVACPYHLHLLVCTYLRTGSVQCAKCPTLQWIRGTGTSVTEYQAVGWAHASFTEPPYPEASQHAVLLHTRLGCWCHAPQLSQITYTHMLMTVRLNVQYTCDASCKVVVYCANFHSSCTPRHTRACGSGTRW